MFWELTSANVVNIINEGKIHIVELDLDLAAAESVKNGFLKADLKPVSANVYLVVVPTPFKGDHEPDISYVQAATETITHYRKKDIFILLNPLYCRDNGEATSVDLRNKT